ncbi:MAG: hypothetical protein K1X46_11155 [Chitinophagaceae bacterium]|nr:hypothetical protein [Chitinophagaceae bacterium]
MGILFGIISTIGIGVILFYCFLLLLCMAGFVIAMPVIIIQLCSKKENRRKIWLPLIAITIFSFACWLWFTDH